MSPAQLDELRRLYHATGWEADGWRTPLEEHEGRPVLAVATCTENSRHFAVLPWGKNRFMPPGDQIVDAERAADALAALLNLVEEIVDRLPEAPRG